MSASLRLCCGDCDTLSLVSVRRPSLFVCSALLCSALAIAHPRIPTLQLESVVSHTVGVRKCSVGRHLTVPRIRPRPQPRVPSRSGPPCRSADLRVENTTLHYFFHFLIFLRSTLLPQGSRVTDNSLFCNGIISGGSGGRSTDLRAHAKADCRIHPLCTSLMSNAAGA